jgi:hypothetical protein
MYDALISQSFGVKLLITRLFISSSLLSHVSVSAKQSRWLLCLKSDMEDALLFTDLQIINPYLLVSIEGNTVYNVLKHW